METNAFWKNYKAAYEWQKKHKLTWWSTRCFALEYENQCLQKGLINLSQYQNSNRNFIQFNDTNQQDLENVEGNIANLEFRLNEDLINFLIQSAQHKIELKSKKESELALSSSGEINSEKTFESEYPLGSKKAEYGNLLYGEASHKVLAMEAALNSTKTRYIDTVKPQYWPIIPLKFF